MGKGHSMIEYIMFIGCKISMVKNKNDIQVEFRNDYSLAVV